MGSNIIYKAGGYGNGDDVKFTSLDLVKENDHYYLSAKLRVEDEHSVREIVIPRINLHVNEDRLSLRSETCPYSNRGAAYINLGFGELPLELAEVDGRYVMYTEEIIEEKYTEMTMDEIEKKLGYKVKIVNK